MYHSTHIRMSVALCKLLLFEALLHIFDILRQASSVRILGWYDNAMCQYKNLC